MRHFKEECHLLSLAQDVNVVHAAVVKRSFEDMFGSAHRQHLAVAFRHFDETMDEVLRKLGAPSGTPLFARLRDDVDPVARARVVRAIAGMRNEVREFMASHDMTSGSPDLSATHAARARLDLAMVSASELGPRHLRGYGELAPDEAQALTTLSERLCECIAETLAALPERFG